MMSVPETIRSLRSQIHAMEASVEAELRVARAASERRTAVVAEATQAQIVV